VNILKYSNQTSPSNAVNFIFMGIYLYGADKIKGKKYLQRHNS